MEIAGRTRRVPSLPPSFPPDTRAPKERGGWGEETRQKLFSPCLIVLPARGEGECVRRVYFEGGGGEAGGEGGNTALHKKLP